MTYVGPDERFYRAGFRSALSRQRDFAARVAEIRAMVAQQAASRQRLDDLFQSMLHRAFQGDL